MISNPALLLILAGGLAVLWQGGSGRFGKGTCRLVAALSLAFVLGVSIYADHNLYTDPAFSRPNFRSVARYLRRNMAPGETVLLLSGHMFPVFDYYAPGMERHLLPDSPTLDTTRTLDYSIAQDLNAWLAGQSGVWVLRWQDEVVDPVGYLAAMLTEAGTQEPVRKFRKLGLEHYRLSPGATFSNQPPIAHSTDYDFGHLLRLLGYSHDGKGEITLFWTAQRPLDEDYRVALVLRDPSGQIWGRWDGRPSAYLYPTTRWRVGQTVFGRHKLDLLPGIPPGDYFLEVGLYTEEDLAGLDLLDSTGVAQGKRALLGPIRLSLPASGLFLGELWVKARL